MIVWFGGQIQFWGWREWGYTGITSLNARCNGAVSDSAKGKLPKFAGAQQILPLF